MPADAVFAHPAPSPSPPSSDGGASDAAAKATTSPAPSTAKADKPTPMFAQFFALKDEAGDALLFFRMGDFYELFFDDAVEAAAILDIALTARGTHAGEPVAMCGVPVATAKTYLARLVAAGRRVAVCEQVEDPAEAKAAGRKGPLRRAIVEVVTPGTVLAEDALDARAPLHVAALGPVGRDGTAALAWADAAAGRLWVTDGPPGRLAAELAAARPAEVIVTAPDALDPDVAAAAAHSGAALTSVGPAAFDAKAAARRLAEAFGVDALEGLGDFTAQDAAALGALVAYVAAAHPSAHPDAGLRWKPPQRVGAAAHMAIDPATRASLELERTQAGRREGALLAAIDRTATGPGARVLAARLARPLVDPAAVTARLDQVEAALADRDARCEARTALRALADPGRALGRLRLGRGGPRDLLALVGAVETAQRLADWGAARAAQEEGQASLAVRLKALAPGEPCAAFAAQARALLAEPAPAHARDGGAVRPGVDEAIDRAHGLARDGRAHIAALQADYAKETGVSALKIKHTGAMGYFVEVAAKHADRLREAPHDARFRQRQTLASAVRFVTEELTRLEGEMAAASDRALALEIAAVDALIARAVALAGPLDALADALAELDCDLGLAEWAVEARAVRPVVDEGTALAVEGGRHPVVEAALAKNAEPFTPNPLNLDAAAASAPRVALVTGPNMAGKSTYLRQAALIAILAQIGSFVPATAAHVGVVDRVFSRVGAADDLARGRSTFMTEMVETAAILNQAGPRALVILDEVGRGTSTHDGLAIAQAAVEHIHDALQCRALFATHYHELTALEGALPGLANLSLRAKEWKGEIVFLHEVAAGPADRSYGVDVARRAGLPAPVVKRARELLRDLEERARRAADAASELPLFAAAHAPAAVEEPAHAAPPAPDPIAERLAAVDPDALTPREALDVVYALKALVDGPAAKGATAEEMDA